MNTTELDNMLFRLNASCREHADAVEAVEAECGRIGRREHGGFDLLSELVAKAMSTRSIMELGESQYKAAAQAAEKGTS